MNQRIWVITDTHFHHTNLTTKYHERPESFTEMVIKNWRNAVQNGDLTIHLGDVTFGKESSLKETLASIPGDKVLVKGNHDNKSNRWYLNNGFVWVCDEFTLEDVLFSHVPVKDLPERYRLNVHGHTHGNAHRHESWMSKPAYKEFALEYTDFKPVLMEELVR